MNPNPPSHPTASRQPPPAPILPGASLGVLGGGQLGRMFCQAAQAMGYRTVVLDPDPLSPAGLIAHLHLRAAYDDAAALSALAQECQAVTTEFENVPALTLETLAVSVPVAPPAEAVAIAQDREIEKQLFVQCGAQTAPYTMVVSVADFLTVQSSHFPAILKTARLGYDGKGQARIASAVDLPAAWQTLGNARCILEKMLPLAYEVSVIVARSADGSMVNLPPQRNIHRDGILAASLAYSEAMPGVISQRAITLAQNIAKHMHYVGVLCVEFFVLQDTKLIVNEIAPRPHNSGHYSINACDVSQFELQIRTLCNLPLIPPRQHSAAIMLNLLGDIWHQHQGTPPFDQILQLPGTHLHLYGKTEAKPGRKMGHITITAPTSAVARQRAQQICQILGLGNVT